MIPYPLNMIWLQTVVIAAGILVILRKLIPAWRRYQETVRTMKDIDNESPHWLFGHLRYVTTDEAKFKSSCALMKKYPKCHPIWIGPFFAYVRGYCPDFMKTALSRDDKKDDTGYRYFRAWIGDGLLTSHGAKWKRNRRLLTPAFHFDILQRYLHCMNQSTADLLNIWYERAKDQRFLEVEIFHDISRMSLDGMLRCLFTKESDCQRDENNEYLRAVKHITETIMKRFSSLLYASDFIFHLTPLGKAFKKSLRTVNDFTSDLINERKRKYSEECNSKTDKELDFLDILLNAKDDRGIGLTYQEIRDEINTFVFEGHDTVSSGMSWAMYNLAAYPKFQDKCREEVKKVLGGKSRVDWQDLPKFKYLTMFIKESMRIYPPVYAVGRSLSKPLFFPRGFGKDQYNTSEELPHGSAKEFSKEFPTNTNFTLSVQHLHCNPHLWKDPFVFDPERFNPENSEKRSPYIYLPFSAGPRNCIGQNFAMNEMKVMISRTLANFRIHINTDMPSPQRKPSIVMRSKTGIHLKLERLAL